MKNIHISLVGGQTAPVYWGAINADPEEVVLICSEQTDEEAQRVKELLHIPTTILYLSTEDYPQMIEMAYILKEKYSSDKVSVNITGGVKLWSISFYEAFIHQENANVFYFDQNNSVWNLSTRQKSLSVAKFDMDIHLGLYGTPIISYHKFSDYTEDDEKVFFEIKKLINIHYRTYKELTMVLNPFNNASLQNNKNGLFTARDGSYVKWNKVTSEAEILIYNKNKTNSPIKLCSPHLMELLFNSGWFEYEVAKLLSKIEDIKEIRLNCIFKMKNGMAKNEIDIIAERGGKLLFVECKTQINKPTDLDKFHNAVKNYGGTGSKGIFISNSPIKELIEMKCKDNNILYYSLAGERTALFTDEEALTAILNGDQTVSNKK